MKDIRTNKISKPIISVQTPLAPTFSYGYKKVQKNVATRLSSNFYTYGVLTVLCLSVGFYVASMIGITVIAVQDKNYTFQTNELKASNSEDASSAQESEVLALSQLNLKNDHIEHLYILNEQTGNMSRK
jgi:hypothetical protein